jgi:hypothetical protein
MTNSKKVDGTRASFVIDPSSFRGGNMESMARPRRNAPGRFCWSRSGPPESAAANRGPRVFGVPRPPPSKIVAAKDSRPSRPSDAIARVRQATPSVPIARGAYSSRLTSTSSSLSVWQRLWLPRSAQGRERRKPPSAKRGLLAWGINWIVTPGGQESFGDRDCSEWKAGDAKDSRPSRPRASPDLQPGLPGFRSTGPPFTAG